MNFGFDSITLWSKRGERRSLTFARNRVNVLSGESHTGKSALLDVIDYCFLASSHKLPDSVINENVEWYGLKFYVNDKTYALARKSPRGNNVSDEYYFSSLGSMPDAPVVNAREDDIREILEAEFKIDEKVIIPYGGSALRANSKVSFRYFFLFNTISEDIITNSKVFFDKQSEDRYREALPRIFDMALGIDDLANMAARERKEALEKELARAERKNSQLRSGRDDFDSEVREIAAKAAAYGIFDGNSKAISREVVRRAIDDAASAETGRALDRHAVVSAELFSLERRLRKLKQFTSEYRAYKDTLKTAEDSLLPIEQLIKQAPTLVKSEIFDDLISSLKADLLAIKKSTATKQPVDGQIGTMVRALELQRSALERELTGLPREPLSFATEREKWLFVGEAKGRFSAYEAAAPSAVSKESQIPTDGLQQQIDAIHVRDVDETRSAVIAMINEIAQGYLTDTRNALANYSAYQTDFAYGEKRLRLRKPRSSLIENVGSSSNHMFLHLLQFLALHEVAISHKSPFVPSFLIIDQPSRPYYPDEKPKDDVVLSNSDSEKVSIAFRLLNDFVAHMNNEYQAEFQMIVFEHVPRTTFAGMDYVHLLPEFRNGEALIPQSWQAG
ncbi:DUF3732 domain-containing protein [Cupriavidus sp. WGtm5]|uniref:DUF3732 domain-containing protein n=1 Tax=Cupriavidus sp. WGtm5 TaxID=2919926 RepID=UPI002091B0DB|nr:DUF3732 domain-containing protein [Cupriavidus sp. WGtm5]MCO4891338.1 DUF3732 domain-containing protein [Cupriavidus sp. WGtm5]